MKFFKIHGDYPKQLRILPNHAQENTAGDGRPDSPGYIGAHGMHQEEVPRIFLLPHNLNHAGGHRHRRDAGRTYHRIYLLLGKDDGGDGTLYTAMQALSQCQFWVDGAERARFTNSALDMLSHDIRDVRVATFDEFQSITVSGGTATIDFDDGGKATVNLNNQSAAILQLGEIFGNGVGDFQIVLVQGTTPTAPGNIAWTTEGTHPIDIPSGGLDINASASGRTLIDVVYDGYRWYLIGTPMSQYIAS